MPIVFRIPVLILVSAAVMGLVLFSFLAGEDLMQLPQLDLQVFERLPIDLVLRVAFQITAPTVFVLPEDVFCGMHWESIAGHFRCASEERKKSLSIAAFIGIKKSGKLGCLYYTNSLPIVR